MNATTKTFNSRLAIGRSAALPLARPQLRTMVLMAAILLTAFAVVYVKDLNRRLFMSYQDLKQKHIELNINYGKLLLEESSLAAQSRVQQLAEINHGMQMPTASNTIIIKL